MYVRTILNEINMVLMLSAINQELGTAEKKKEGNTTKLDSL